MLQKIFITIFLTLMFVLCDKLIAQYPTSPKDINDIKELLKNEDFGNLNKLLKANEFTITKSNLNYSHGSFYVIAEIDCEKNLGVIKSKKSFSEIENIEKLSLEFYEYDAEKMLTIYDDYITDGSDFLSYYYNWKNLNWTYVDFRFNSNWNSLGIKLGEEGSMGTFGNQLKKVPNDSIDIRETGNILVGYKPTFKKMQFKNYNQNLGTLCNYICELRNPWPKNDYDFFFGTHIVDTAYSFYMTLQEYYPKIKYSNSNKSITKFITVPLIKSGKTYFINIYIGTKKKKYILDSGASDFTIDESSYRQLLEKGIINITHKLSDGEYQMADGSIKTYKRTLIPGITIGNAIIENVVATIIRDGQPLLLGKSVLDNFKTWKIDNSKNVLIIETD